MDFNLNQFLEEGKGKIGEIKEVRLEYWQCDEDVVGLVISVSNGKHPLKMKDYHCQTIMKFPFAGEMNEEYAKAKGVAKEIRASVKKMYPDAKIYRATKI